MDGIHSIPANGQAYLKQSSPDVMRQKKKELAVNLEADNEVRPVDPAIAKESLKQLERVIPTLNQRLEYQFNKDLGQVIVKIIDRDTDTLIKELPPAEFQRMHLAIREAIGQLIDKKV